MSYSQRGAAVPRSPWSHMPVSSELSELTTWSVHRLAGALDLAQLWNPGGEKIHCLPPLPHNFVPILNSVSGEKEGTSGKSAFMQLQSTDPEPADTTTCLPSPLCLCCWIQQGGAGGRWESVNSSNAHSLGSRAEPKHPMLTSWQKPYWMEGMTEPLYPSQICPWA